MDVNNFWAASIVILLGTVMIRRYYKQKYKRELTLYEKVLTYRRMNFLSSSIVFIR